MPFDHTHYVPILKGKQGELNALQDTNPKLLTKFTPLIEIPPIPPAWPEGENQKPIPAKTIDEHIKAVAKARGPLGLDLGATYLIQDAAYDRWLVPGSEPRVRTIQKIVLSSHVWACKSGM